MEQAFNYGVSERELFDPTVHERLSETMRDQNIRSSFPASDTQVVALLEATLEADEFDKYFGDDGHDPEIAQQMVHAAKLHLERAALSEELHTMRDSYQRTLVQQATQHIPGLPSTPSQISGAVYRADKEIREPSDKVAMRQMQLNEHVLCSYSDEMLSEGVDPILAELEGGVLQQRDCYQQHVLAGEERTASARNVLNHLLQRCSECDPWERQEYVEDLELANEPIPPKEFQAHLNDAAQMLKSQKHMRERAILKTVQTARGRARELAAERKTQQVDRFVSAAHFRRTTSQKTQKRPQSMRHVRHFEGQLSDYVQLGDKLHAVVSNDDEFAHAPVPNRNIALGTAVEVSGSPGNLSLSVVNERGGHER